MGNFELSYEVVYNHFLPSRANPAEPPRYKSSSVYGLSLSPPNNRKKNDHEYIASNDLQILPKDEIY